MESLKRKRNASSIVGQGETSAKARETESASSSRWDYDVFLSFRGPDTRDGFTDYLYEDLMKDNIQTFIDREDLHAGEEIGPSLVGAIKRSKIFVPIFSKGYISSKWCLRELAYMVKHKHENQVILPVFYDMDPYDVRRQSGCYEDVFRQHKERGISDENIGNWKKALSTVGTLKGLVLENDANGSKGKLKNLVVERVSNLLQKPSVIVIDKLVGIDHQVDEVLKLLQTNMDDVRSVGICGMGGIGKTTLAKVIYNKISNEFHCCSFLPDVRDLSRRYGLIYLQKQLITDIFKGKSRDFLREDEGIKIISDKFCTKKILVVLDDVDERKQIDMLAGSVEWFGPGSRIIVTTRDIEVSNSSQKYEIYHVKELGSENSLRLLCWHAFGVYQTLENEQIAKDIVSTTGGLPLAIKVIGSYLHKKEHSKWVGALKRLKKGPFSAVQQAFMISYEALSCEGKQIFLDIACLFIGFDKDLVFYMWDSCNFCPEYEIDVLINMSLIKINKDNKFYMHDQLRDFGRMIVNQENMPGNNSRLWNYEEALEVLTKYMGTKNVEALSLDLRPPFLFRDETFANLLNLRFLKLSYADLYGDFQGLLPNVMWLSWHVYSQSIVPVNFCLKKLVILDLTNSDIGEDWGGWSLVKESCNLKVLKLTQCHRLRRTPEFPENATIEKLYLNRCYELCEIEPTIRYLKSLVLLDIRCCDVKELPAELGSLTFLVELLLDETRIRALPESTGALTRLKKLSLRGCSFFRELPTCIGGLKSLKELVLRKTIIQGLPDSARNLHELIVFDASYTNMRKLLDAIWQLEKLEVIDVSNCYYLEGGIPFDFRTLSLKILRVTNTGIRYVEQTASRLSHLEELDIRGLRQMPICRLPRTLRTFMGPDILKCLSRPLPSLQFFSRLYQLETLKLVDANLRAITGGIQYWCRLKYLSISMCNKLQIIPALPKNLIKLKIKNCRSLENLCDLCTLKHLNSLGIRGLLLKRINGLGGLASLCTLSVKGCSKLSSLDGIEHLSHMKELKISQCPSLRALPDLSNLRGLRYVDHGGCNIELQGIGANVKLYS